MALRVRVCALADVADGALRAFAVPGVTWPVIVTRVDGELFAVPGVCPHEDVGLADGELIESSPGAGGAGGAGGPAGAAIVCPGHGYAFDLATGRCRHDPALVLRRYPITLVDSDVWVDLL